LKRRKALQGCNMPRDRPAGAHRDGGSGVGKVSSPQKIIPPDERPLYALSWVLRQGNPLI